MAGQITAFDALVIFTVFAAFVAVLAYIADTWDARVNQARHDLARPYDQDRDR